MKIKINNKEYRAKLGETVLEVCRRYAIRIPNLCSYGTLENQAVCRLCLVETNRTDKLVTACTFRVCEGLEVITESEQIRRSRKTNLELLFVDHAGKCAQCKKNQRCELQRLAMEEKVENFHFVPKSEELTNREEIDLIKDNKAKTFLDNQNPVIERNGELCVKCRRCIGVCPTEELGLQNRSAQMSVGTSYGKPLDCIFCGACLNACPTGALTDQNDLGRIIFELDDLKKQAVAILDPLIMDWISEEFPNIKTENQLARLLKEVGFEKIFSLREGESDFWEKTKKEAQKNKQGNLFLSYCQSFNLYLKKYRPEFLKNLSVVPLPDEILAEKIKTEYAEKEKIDPKSIRVFSVSHCVAKKTLGKEYLDGILTERELGRIVRVKKIKLDEMGETELDGEAGKENSTLFSSGVVSVSGIAGIKKLLDKISKREIECGIIEALICEGGCDGKRKTKNSKSNEKKD